MPGHVERQVVAAVQTGRAPSSQLTPCSVRPGLVHMGDRVQRPGVRGLVLERGVAGQLGRMQLAAFLESERMTTLEKAVARHRRVPGGQHGRGGGQHPAKSPQHEAQGMAELDRQKVARLGRYVPIDQVGCGGQSAGHGLGQRGDQGPLAGGTATACQLSGFRLGQR